MAERRSGAADLPLFHWGDALRVARAQRRRLRRRAVALGCGIAAMAMTIILPPRPVLVWNASASMPVGLYRISSADTVAVGGAVLARVPASLRALAARRHYLPSTVPLVKRVAAGPGDDICAFGRAIWINGRRAAERRAADRAGHTMPWWSGCMRLRGHALFLLGGDTPESFDGRYFGPSDARDIIGKATLLWRR